MSAVKIKEYRVTFGRKFGPPSFDLHKTFGKAHPDGWVSVFAETELEARTITLAVLGTEWSGIYDLKDVDWDMFPLGELARFGGEMS